MRRLLLAAGERETESLSVPQGAWSGESDSQKRRVPTLNASASYERAVKLSKKISVTEDPKELLELHDILSRDPMGDMGFSEIKEAFEAVRSRIVEKFRQKVYTRGGWGFE